MVVFNIIGLFLLVLLPLNISYFNMKEEEEWETWNQWVKDQKLNPDSSVAQPTTPYSKWKHAAMLLHIAVSFALMAL